jgi:SAM-dependent methyltransferase
MPAPAMEPTPDGVAGTGWGGPGIPWLFSATLFVGAALLFSVQPMVARMILPLLGGSPSVWNTCMVFFQAALLAGYAYAHASAAWGGVRRQMAVHVVVLLLPLMVLPIVVRAESLSSLPSVESPILWLLALLVGTVGLPFFVVAATAPLLQAWFARTGHPSGRDPYFLYAASNLGSMLALLGYPLLIEPNLRLADQSLVWAAGYVVLVALIGACAVVVWRAPAGGSGELAPEAGEVDADRPTIGRRLGWVGLAFVPSSLLIGVTTYLSTDVAAIPLLWVVPLALYLLTFILVFARRVVVPGAWVSRGTAILLLILVVVMCLRGDQILWIPLHLIVFFGAAMACHGELARRRPSARHLTGFYLAMSLGGVLGGTFNSLLALAALVNPVSARAAGRPVGEGERTTSPSSGAARARSGRWARALDFGLPLALGLVVGGVSRYYRLSPWDSDDLWVKLVYGAAALACFSFSGRPVRFALGVAAMFSASLVSEEGQILHRSRSFFGVLEVERTGPGPTHRLIHGSTLHGRQNLDPERRREALTYYHRTGPIGQVLDGLRRRAERSSVAVVGLGTGTLASYAGPGDRWTFYEIDPDVVRVARDPRLFTFLTDCRATRLDVVLGDARLRLREAPDRSYDLLILDAFSSDAIPMHLLTREALRVYRGKLAPGGILAFHISNRYIDLAPALGALARDAGLVCRVRDDTALDPAEKQAGKTPSRWLVMAARESDLSGLADDARWVPPAIGPDEPIWTEDFSNLVHYLKIR